MNQSCHFCVFSFLIELDRVLIYSVLYKFDEHMNWIPFWRHGCNMYASMYDCITVSALNLSAFSSCWCILFRLHSQWISNLFCCNDIFRHCWATISNRLSSNENALHSHTQKKCGQQQNRNLITVSIGICDRMISIFTFFEQNTN